jgi:MFS family permease
MRQNAKEDLVERVEHVEKGLADPVSPSGSSSKSAQEFDKKRAARIRHRIDWRLIPALGAMYGISLMDRKNVSNAAVAGMLKDLGIGKGLEYNLVNLLFFVTYILLQPLTIVMCRKIGPRYFLPGICILWGGVIIGFGFAKNWQTLVPLRLILGGLESGYFPGCLYLLSCWYTKCKFHGSRNGGPGRLEN